MKKFVFTVMTLAFALLSTMSVNAQENFLKRGFRGFAELSESTGFSDAEDEYLLQAGFTGGYQINRMFFVGGGVAPSLYLYDNDWTDEIDTGFVMPIYGAFRADFIDNTISPFAEIRGGYYITDDYDSHGGYFYTGGGCRFKRFSVSAGYSLYAHDHYTGSFATVKAAFEF